MSDGQQGGISIPHGIEGAGYFADMIYRLPRLRFCFRRKTPKRIDGVPSPTAAKFRSIIIRFLHPLRNVSFGMKYTPNVDMIWPVMKKDQIGISLQRNAPQIRQSQLVCIPQRSGLRMACDQIVSSLKCVDKAKSHVGSSFMSIVIDGCLDITSSKLSGNNRFAIHLLRRPAPVREDC
ncbi:hypothetical protein LCM4579_25225 [Ensifer sp. LCM 4579]|nr:hypothetical protein LCM4579_25225 [Ensifer sp. LCM 4579]